MKELGVVRSLLGENTRYLIELRVVRSLLEDSEVFNSVESCEEFVSRMARYLIELGVVRRMLREIQGI